MSKNHTKLLRTIRKKKKIWSDVFIYCPYIPLLTTDSIGPQNLEEAWQSFLFKQGLSAVYATRYSFGKLDKETEDELEKK